MRKKNNMEYWDVIDDLTERYVCDFLNCAIEKITLDTECIEHISKNLQYALLNELSNYDVDVKKSFPYNTENY